MKVILKKLDKIIHNKYISKLEYKDIPYLLSFHALSPKGFFYWIDDEGTYFLLHNHHTRGKHIIVLHCPPIKVTGEYDFEKAKFYLDNHNLDVVIDKDKIDVKYRYNVMSFTKIIVYEIYREEFLSLKGKKYKYFRNFFNKMKKNKDIKFTHKVYKAGDKNLPYEAIKSLITDWKLLTKKSFHLYHYLNLLLDATNKEICLITYAVNGELFSYSVIEKLREDYFFLLDGKHMLRGDFKFNVSNIMFYIHYNDIQTVFNLTKENKVYCNIGSGNVNLMNSKKKLKNHITLPSQIKYFTDKKCNIEFIIPDDKPKSNLISLF